MVARKSADAEQLTALPTKLRRTIRGGCCSEGVRRESPGASSPARLAESDPPNVDAVVWLGILASKAANSTRPASASLRHSRWSGHLEATWHWRCWTWRKRLDRAVVGFETVMGEDSTYANGLFFTARCYEAMGKTKRRSSATTNTYLTPRTPWWPTAYRISSTRLNSAHLPEQTNKPLYHAKR